MACRQFATTNAANNGTKARRMIRSPGAVSSCQGFAGNGSGRVWYQTTRARRQLFESHSPGLQSKMGQGQISLRSDRNKSKELQPLWRFPPLKCVPA